MSRFKDRYYSDTYFYSIWGDWDEHEICLDNDDEDNLFRRSNLKKAFGVGISMLLMYTLYKGLYPDNVYILW
jgi:hypothetical protein